MEKSKEYKAYLVTKVHSTKKVKQAFENVGEMTRTNSRDEKHRVINKNTISFPAEDQM